MHKPIIIGLAIFVVVSLAIADMPDFILGNAAKNWPTTSGTIKERKVEPYKMGTTTGFKNSVSYVYMVGTRVIFGDRIKFQPKILYDGLETAEFEKCYPVGKKLIVHYNPDNHDQSCLQPGASSAKLLGQLVIYLILAAIIYFSIYPVLNEEEQAEKETEAEEPGLQES